MSTPRYDQSPTDVLDYDVDFAQWLESGDTVTAATATISGDGTIVIDSYSNTTTAAKVWVSGGAAGDEATVQVVAETAGGRTKTNCFRIRIKEC